MPVDLSVLRAKLEELKTGQKAMDQEYLQKFFVPPDGDSLLRILPGRGESQFYAETAIHRMNDKNVHCPGRQTCPICKYVSQLYDSKTEENVELARKIKAKKRFYFNVIARDHKDPQTGEMKKNVGPLVFSCGIKLFEKILGTFVDPDFGDLTDLADGWDFKVVKKEKEGYPNYDDSRARPKQSPASEDVSEVKKWMENLHDLQALVQRKTPEELKSELDSFLNGNTSEKSAVGVNPNPPTEKAKPSPKVEEDTKADGKTDDSSADFLAELRKLRENKK